MNVRLFVALYMFTSVAYSTQTTCYLTVVKNDCWKNYNVEITLTDLKSKKVMATLMTDKGKLWGRTTFQCELGAVIEYSATYSPVYWQSDKNKIFHSNKFWTLPDSLQGSEKALNITICFPDQFVGTPTPPEATSTCKCDKSIAPEIKLPAVEANTNAQAKTP